MVEWDRMEGIIQQWKKADGVIEFYFKILQNRIEQKNHKAL